MESEKIHFAPTEPGEYIILHGESEPIHVPGPISLSGNFDAPAEFVAKRASIKNDEQWGLDMTINAGCHVIFDKRNLTITLVVGEQERDTITVTGKLTADAFLASLGINTSSHSPKELLKLVRFKAHLFADRADHRTLVTWLMNPEIKTDTHLKKSDNRLGSMESLSSANAKTDIAGMNLKLTTPLFEGGPKVEVSLSVEVEPDNGSVKLFLISETFEEFYRAAVDAEFALHEETFAPFVIIRKG